MDDRVWKKIPNDRVQHVWRCPKCKDRSTVNPPFYQEAGTPYCGDCDRDMEFVRTEILVRPKKKDSAPQTSERPIQLE